MPQLGLTMTEGKVVRWLKTPGAPVTKGEPVVEIETDKVSVELEAPASGILGPILAQAGMVVPIGGVLGHVITATEGQEGTPHAMAKRAPEPRHVAASPLARRRASELGVDLAEVEGSGPGGRILEADVEHYALQRRAEKATSAPAHTTASLAEVEPLSGIRRVVAERMTASFTSAPHFYLSVEAEATALLRMRDGLLAKVEAATGVHLTLTDILIKVCAQALREFPRVNASWVEGQAGSGVRRHTQVNVGIAVSLDDGLIVPVVHEADQLTLAEIARRRADLVTRARDGRLTLSDLERGTFTLSNLGMFDIDQFAAILNPPQAALLAVGRIKERPLVADGQVVARPTVCLTLTSDHRVLDGAEAARFLERLARLVQEPYLLVA